MQSLKLKPLSIWQSLLLVLIPSTASIILYYYVVPEYVKRTGRPFASGYLPAWIGIMATYFLASIIAFKLEGNKVSIAEFAKRYRLKGIRGRDWIWLLALLVSFLVVAVSVTLLGKRLSSTPPLTPPESFPPELNPSKSRGIVPGVFMGMSLQGNWWVAAVYLLGWIMNILGEEFWYRGFMLPRQEVAYGDRAWILHGVVWALNHLWQGWTLIILFPYSFLWSFIIQRARNTTIPIIVHGLGNLSVLIFIIAGVLG